MKGFALPKAIISMTLVIFAHALCTVIVAPSSSWVEYVPNQHKQLSHLTSCFKVQLYSEM